MAAGGLALVQVYTRTINAAPRVLQRQLFLNESLSVQTVMRSKQGRRRELGLLSERWKRLAVLAELPLGY